MHYKKDFRSCQLRNLPYLIGGRCRVIVAVFRVTGTCHILLWGTRIHSKQIIMSPLNKKTSNNYIFSLSNVAWKVPAKLFISVKVELYLSYVVLRYLGKEHPWSPPTCSFVAQYYSYNILVQISSIFLLFRKTGFGNCHFCNWMLRTFKVPPKHLLDDFFPNYLIALTYLLHTYNIPTHFPVSLPAYLRTCLPSTLGFGCPGHVPSRSRGSPNFRNLDIVFVASTLSHFDMTAIQPKKCEIIRPAVSQAFAKMQNAKRRELSIIYGWWKAARFHELYVCRVQSAGKKFRCTCWH